jgi:hypothetical protein
MSERLGAQFQTGGIGQSISNGLLPAGDLLYSAAGQVPAVDWRFAQDRSLVDRIRGLPLTFTRTTSRAFEQADGTLGSVGVDAPAFSFSSGVPRGLDIWETRTNSIRNNTMVGAVAGTPGTLPTNWTAGGGSGTTQFIVGTGTESGIAYIDIRIFGTTSSAMFFGVGTEGTNVVAATPNSIWTSTFYVRLVGGSLTNVTGVKNVLTNFNSSGAALNQFAVASLTPTSATLATQRYSVSTTSATFADATTAFVRSLLQVEANSGVAIDITLRIGLPQLELGSNASPCIATAGSTVQRTADVCSTTDLSWYNASGGTWYVDWQLSGRNPGAIQNAFNMSNGGTDQLLIFVPAGNTLSTNTFVASVSQGRLDVSGTPTAGTAYRSAVSFASGSRAFTINGVTPTTGSGSLSAATQLEVGLGLGSGQLCGTISRLAYFPPGAAANNLQRMTA